MVKTSYFCLYRDWIDVFKYSKETETKKEIDSADNVLQVHDIETDGDRLPYKYTESDH